MDKKITTPITEEVTRDLRSGDYVYITGTMYVARDAAHKRMIEVLTAAKNCRSISKMQQFITWDRSPARDGRPIGSAGPTTAVSYG